MARSSQMVRKHEKETAMPEASTHSEGRGATTAATAPVSGTAVPRLERTTQAFVDGLAGSPPIYTLSPEDARKVLLDAQASPPLGAPGALARASIEDRELPLGPTGTTRIRIIRPERARSRLPVILYFHGGGWVLGDKTTHDRLVRELAVGVNAALVFVDYERSPEHRYPVAIEQAYAVTLYVAEHPEEFDVDPARLAVAGDSVGGNMAAVVALLAKERDGPPIKAQAMFYPVTDAAMNTASYDTFAEGPWLTRKAMEWFWDAYLPDASRRGDIHVSPLRAAEEQLTGLPPALLITDENDVLRDEGEAYARKLARAGVPVTARRYDGTIHDFMLLNPLAETAPVRRAIAQASDFLRDALEA
ncbi:MAG TPA: alpha/beta hydrolase [Pedomonas sp.]|uniref:alpha/beta hydrolase n=1 Tax=Pedomonas sp. TaxID=2976421 RepID=UPI002F3EC639